MASRTTVAIAGSLVVGIAIGVLGTKLSDRTTAPAQNAIAKHTTTVAVQRRTLAVTETATGQLAPAQEQNLTTIGSGVVTAPAVVGTRLDRGSVVARVDDSPVVVMFGSIPVWRAFASGMTPGPDVAELEANLVALGFGGNGLVVDNTFTASTASAVQRWEKSLGIASTDGTVAAGEVVVVPSAVQVSQTVVAGTRLSPGSTLAVVRPIGGEGLTLTFPVTQAADRYQPGHPVTIVSSDGSRHAARITSLDRAASSGGNGGFGGGGGGGSSSYTVSATPVAPKGLVAGPVSVEIPTSIATNVLAVPSRALVAVVQGDQAVELASNHQLVAVKVGVFADGWVEVSGNGIAEGVGVVVPT